MLTVQSSLKPRRSGLFAVFLLAAALLCQPASATDFKQQRGVAEGAVKQWQKRYPKADAHWVAGQPGANIVTGLALKTPGKSLRARAEAFLQQARWAVGVPAEQLRFTEMSRSQHRVVARFQQVFGGRRVLDRLVAVRMQQDGTVLGFVSDAMPVANVSRAEVPMSAAQHIAATWIGARQLDSSSLPAEGQVMAHPSGSRPVWVVHVIAVPMRAHYEVLIDAVDGTVLRARNLILH